MHVFRTEKHGRGAKNVLKYRAIYSIDKQLGPANSKGKSVRSL